MENNRSACCDVPKVGSSNGNMVARTGRHQQRYDCGYRLIAGCVPYRYVSDCVGDRDIPNSIEVLMVTTQGGPGLLFPKGGWETDETAEEAACREAFEEAGVKGQLKECLGSWEFKSKRQQSDHNPEGLCKAYMFPLLVTEELESWPEQHARNRHWFKASEAVAKCRYEWMQNVLDDFLSHLCSESLHKANGRLTSLST